MSMKSWIFGAFTGSVIAIAFTAHGQLPRNRVFSQPTFEELVKTVDRIDTLVNQQQMQMIRLEQRIRSLEVVK